MYKQFLNKQFLNKKSGQVLIENMILLPLVGSCFIVSLLVFYIYAQHLWMDHQLYQAVICIAKNKPNVNCQNQMKKKIKLFLQIGSIKNIQLSGGDNKWNGNLIWHTPLWKMQLKKNLN